MNRRKAIGRIVLAGIGGGVLFSGYKWYDWHKTPDMEWLHAHRSLVADLSEAIIPATDTPGAREAGVADYILLMIRDATGRLSANKFIDGLKDLDHFCHNRYDRPFGQCSASEQTDVLTHFENKAHPFNRLSGKIENAYLGM
ncbi:MAG TPA: gluconate 2-dehydrogenase subunit 3 family protein, partial [Puia sp.]|nr:gluconate 2-dehydrogenase subunit 3 family protein [Puia sp.]